MTGPLIIPLEEIAEHYGLSLRTLTDSRWRARAGLPVVKLGGRVIGVRASDLRRALRRERLTPPNGSDGA
jgi:hypothetical protein